MFRAYSKHSLDGKYNRRISWISGQDFLPKIAIAEYAGKFPGRDQHGNSNINDTKYIRTRPEVMDKIREAIREKPGLHVWQDIVAPDEVGGPRSRKQIINMKYNEKKRLEREKEGEGYRATFADQIKNLEDMVKTDGSFVKSVKISENRVPAAVLYDDNQIKDLLRFCCNSPVAKTTKNV